jgi:hypothetical protein
MRKYGVQKACNGIALPLYEWICYKNSSGGGNDDDDDDDNNTNNKV